MANKKEELSISFDISTTNCGIVAWRNSDGKAIDMRHLELKVNKEISKEDREIIKAENFRKYIIEYKKEFEANDSKIVNIIIEQALINSTNRFTASMLLSFNGMIRYILYSVFQTIPKLVSVHQARSIFSPELIKIVRGKPVLSFPEEYKKDKKQYLLERVTLLEPDFEWKFNKRGSLDQSNYDVSDAYVTGFAGLTVLGIIKP